MLKSYELSVANVQEVVNLHPAFLEFTMLEDEARNGEYLVTHPDYGSIRIDLEGVDWDRHYIKKGKKKIVKGDPTGSDFRQMAGQLQIVAKAMYSIASEKELETLILELGGASRTRSHITSLHWIFSYIGIEEYNVLGFTRELSNGRYGVRPPEFLLKKAKEQLLYHSKRGHEGTFEPPYTQAQDDSWKWFDTGWYPLEELILKVSRYSREVAELNLAKDGLVGSAWKVLLDRLLVVGRPTDVFCAELFYRVKVLDQHGTWPDETEKGVSW